MRVPRALRQQGPLKQQSPKRVQASSQKQLPPELPHWQAEQLLGSSGQSAGQVHESSPCWHWPLPQTMLTQPEVSWVQLAEHLRAPPPAKPKL